MKVTQMPPAGEGTHSMKVITYAPPFRPPFSGLWKICIVSTSIFEQKWGKCRISTTIFGQNLAKCILSTPLYGSTAYGVDVIVVMILL